MLDGELYHAQPIIMLFSPTDHIHLVKAGPDLNTLIQAQPKSS